MIFLMCEISKTVATSMSHRAVIATASEAKQEARPGVFFYNQFVD